MHDIKSLNHPVTTNITRLVKLKGLKQKYIANKAGINPNHLTDAIAGRRILKIAEVGALAAALEVDVNELYKTN